MTKKNPVSCVIRFLLLTIMGLASTLSAGGAEGSLAKERRPARSNAVDTGGCFPEQSQSGLACLWQTGGTRQGLKIYVLDERASGTVELINNIFNLTVVSEDENDLKAEYRAGFIQGRLQGEAIITDYWKQVPDGAVDAKVGSTRMVRSFMELRGILGPESRETGFWMLYGTPYIHGKPFVWSESLWSTQTLRDVPDRLDGHFTLMRLYLM